MKWALIGGITATVLGVCAQAIPGAGTALGAGLIALGAMAITTPCAVKDAKVAKDLEAEKKDRETEAQQMQEADDRLKVTASSFGTSTQAVLAARTTPPSSSSKLS